MDKEQYYNRIKKWVYGKFDELEVIKRKKGSNVYLRYKNGEYTQVEIDKKFGYVYYYYEFSEKICKHLRIEKHDFEILLKRWVEETFQMKVDNVIICVVRSRPIA